MNFVCLGWGSLIWCQKTLPVLGEWSLDGPELPLEFARESQDKRITLVICEGAPVVRTLWAKINVANLDEAKQVLAIRERISGDNIKHSIGFLSPDGRSTSLAVEAVADWTVGRAVDGVVWTALKPKLGTSYRTPQVDEVIDHLRGLTGAQRDMAEEYVRLAPRQIATPYRRAIEEALGWSPIGQSN